MDIFPKIAKAILYMLIAIILYSFMNDFGKMFVVDSQNVYISRNASSYASKFTVNESSLSGFGVDNEVGDEYKKKSISSEDAAETLRRYFNMQYNGLGYELVESSGTDKMKLIYSPEAFKLSDAENYEHLGPIYVRVILEGFDGTTSRLDEEGVGLVIININQKVPSSLRSIMKSMGTADIDTDFEGFWGYYNVDNTYAFTINLLEKEF